MKNRLYTATRVLVFLILFTGFPLQTLAQDWRSADGLLEYFSEAQREWDVPGMAVGIIKDGEIFIASGFGVRDIETGGAVDAHTLFAIASNTKAFNSAALATLVDAGRLSWTDRVKDHLPYFELYDPYVTQEMRIRDLLSHRSGLGTYSGDLLWYGTDYTPEEVLRRARHLPPARGFREGYGYSNLMFLAAGEVIPAVTGQTFSEYVQATFLDPLGMDETVLSTNDLRGRTNVATPHGVRDDELRSFEWYNWDTMVAAGGIISNIDDMLRWIQLQLNRGQFEGTRIFSERSSATMWTPHVSIPISSTSRERYPSTHFRAYGLGWSLYDYQGSNVMTHGGGYDGMFSRVALVPDENLGIVILTNGMTGIQTALSYRILDAFLGGEERDWSAESLERSRASTSTVQRARQQRGGQRVAGTTPSHDLESYSGTYGGDLYGDATVTVEAGSLVLRLLPNPDLVGDLEHYHYDTYIVRWRNDFSWFEEGTVQFIDNAAGEVVEFKIDVPNDDFWFTELEFTKK